MYVWNTKLQLLNVNNLGQEGSLGKAEHDHSGALSNLNHSLTCDDKPES